MQSSVALICPPLSSLSISPSSSSGRAQPVPGGSRRPGPRRRERALGRRDAVYLEPAKQHRRSRPKASACRRSACRPRTPRGGGPPGPGQGGHQPSLSSGSVHHGHHRRRHHRSPGGLVWGATTANQWAVLCPVHTTQSGSQHGLAVPLACTR